MSTTAALRVWFADHVVGRLDGADGAHLVLTYDPAWLGWSDAFAISASLPLRAAPFDDGKGHAFFANLLPEGGVRDAICGRLGISRDNDLALLRAIGGECAGALSVLDAELEPARPTRAAYQLLDDRRLQGFVSGGRVIPLLAGGPGTRLSLAGAQDKVPVALLDGKLHLPIGTAPSTHILKLPHRDFAHLPINEAFVLALAARVGLDVVSAELTARTDPPSLLIERYDRVASDSPWPVALLHQEDLCQALGLPPTRKYEQEGGPSLAAAIELVRAQVRRPIVDVERVIEWQAFNLCVGNSDGHGKNLSILYGRAGAQLAPFYDLVATRHYPALDRFLAMGVGSQRDPDRIGRAQWEALALALGLGARTVIAMVDGVAERCTDLMAASVADFRARHGAQSVLQTLPRAITRWATRLRRALAPP